MPPRSFQKEREGVNRCRHMPLSPQGHYESYFQRANHPSRPLAFWVRYTIFSPAGRPDDALGEVWAIFFDGESGDIHAAKDEFPLSSATFCNSPFRAAMGDSFLDGQALQGSASGEKTLRWDLQYECDFPPLLLLPKAFYDKGFPKAKALVGSPNARFSGSFWVGEQCYKIDDWIGSQNHNWGSQHTDFYAWGQVASFDNAPDTFLECASARLKVGPVWTPFITLIVLRIGRRTIALNNLVQGLKATARVNDFSWEFSSKHNGVEIKGSIAAPPAAFVGLNYYNPPGGAKHCLNSKIARCDITVTEWGRLTHSFSSKNRAAFEILTDDKNHGIPIVA